MNSNCNYDRNDCPVCAKKCYDKNIFVGTCGIPYRKIKNNWCKANWGYDWPTPNNFIFKDTEYIVGNGYKDLSYCCADNPEECCELDPNPPNMKYKWKNNSATLFMNYYLDMPKSLEV